MPSLIQKPSRWMFDALGIITGQTPQQLDERVTPIIDTMQSGLAFAKYVDSEFVGALGATVGPSSVFVPQTFPRDARFAYLFRCDATNPGTAAASFFIRTYQANVAFAMRLFSIAIAAGGVQSWTDIGAGSQYFFIPPGADLTLETSSFVTTPGRFLFQLVQLPGGTKPW